VGVTRTLLALLLVMLAAVPVAAKPVIPRHTHLVMDLANVISPEKEQLLIDGLVGFRQTQEREVSVITVRDLQGHDLDTFTRQLAIEWGLEDNTNDDGAVLVVAPNELKVGIVVGRAVRSRLPDNLAREIVEAQVLPSFRQGDMDNGILNGAGSILFYLELTPEEAAAAAERQRIELSQAQEGEGFPWAGIAVLLLLLFLWPVVRSFAGPFGFVMGAISLLGSGGGGGRGGGFGGFGGGLSGGGGASGRW